MPAVQLTDRLTEHAAAGACPCLEYHINKVLYGSPECAHTRGERPAELAVPFCPRSHFAETKRIIALEAEQAKVAQ